MLRSTDAALSMTNQVAHGSNYRAEEPHVFCSSRRPSPSALLPVLGTAMVAPLVLLLLEPVPGTITGEMTGSRL